MKRTENKVVIVTGGALGIGRETSILLAKEGAKVAISDILDKEGENLAEEINQSGGVAKFWHLDVSDEKEVESVFASVVKEFGKLDAVVNNAGIAGPNKPTHELTEKEWDAVRLMSKNDALIYAKDNIRVNSVHPGFIWTPLVEELGKDTPGFRKNLDSLHPIGHIGEPIDIAYGILYLISDESKFVTGSELLIDGGYTCQ